MNSSKLHLILAHRHTLCWTEKLFSDLLHITYHYYKHTLTSMIFHCVWTELSSEKKRTVCIMHYNDLFSCLPGTTKIMTVQMTSVRFQLHHKLCFQKPVSCTPTTYWLVLDLKRGAGHLITEMASKEQSGVFPFSQSLQRCAEVWH